MIWKLLIMKMVYLIHLFQLEIYFSLSFAGALAYQIGAKHIITGVCETDFSGYPDCRDSFIKSMNVTLSLAMDKDFVIHTFNVVKQSRNVEIK